MRRRRAILTRNLRVFQRKGLTFARICPLFLGMMDIVSRVWNEDFILRFMLDSIPR